MSLWIYMCNLNGILIRISRRRRAKKMAKQNFLSRRPEGKTLFFICQILKQLRMVLKYWIVRPCSENPFVNKLSKSWKHVYLERTQNVNVEGGKWRCDSGCWVKEFMSSCELCTEYRHILTPKLSFSWQRNFIFHGIHFQGMSEYFSKFPYTQRVFPKYCKLFLPINIPTH